MKSDKGSVEHSSLKNVHSGDRFSLYLNNQTRATYRTNDEKGGQGGQGGQGDLNQKFFLIDIHVMVVIEEGNRGLHVSLEKSYSRPPVIDVYILKLQFEFPPLCHRRRNIAPKVPTSLEKIGRKFHCYMDYI
eukprot:Awhi_evm1s14474